MKLKPLDGEFSVCLIQSLDQVDWSGDCVFLSKTDAELSLVCESAKIPPDALAVESGFRAFRVEGVLDFALIGIIAEITRLLAEEKISVFAVSTYQTDYFLVKAEWMDRAMRVLGENGYAVG